MLLRLTPPWPVNHDCGWYLYLADRLLQGDGLYTDLVDVNPPLISYLSVLPAGLARLLGTGVVPAFDAWVVALIAGSLWCTGRVVRGGVGPIGSGPAVLGAAVFVLAVVPGRDFGQREHLMVLFVLPYLGLAAVRCGGGAVPRGAAAFGVGLVASVGLCLKPYFLLAPLLVAVGTAVRRGVRPAVLRPEYAGIGAGVLLYGLHFAVVPNRAGFAATLDLVREVYGALDVPFGEAIRMPWTVYGLVLGALLAACAATARRGRPSLLVLSMAWLGFLLAAIWQAKGWSYHVLPAILTGGLGLLVYWWGNRGPWLRVLLLLGLLLYTATAVGQRWLRVDPVDGTVGLAPRFTGVPEALTGLAGSPPGSAVLVLDTRFPTFFAWLADRRMRWSSRYACLWVLPGADAARRGRLLGEVLQDIAAGRPHLVYVRRGRPWRVADPEFRLLPWLQGAPVDRTPGVWSGYERVGATAEFDVFRRR